MWHEARKQEKKIKVMMVDYQKRSERRRAYYHRIKADPTQFIRLTGSPCKVYVEEEAMEIKCALSELMPWQGNKSNMIDRFDVRAHLDVIPEYGELSDPSTIDENAVIGQKCSYERWRTLSTNDLVGISEDECLDQIQEDEKIILPIREKKYGAKAAKAAIGFSYTDNAVSEDSEGSEDEEETYLTQDTDLDIRFDVRELAQEQKDKLNEIAANSYSIPDFVRLHIEDKVEAEMREYEMKEEQQRIDRVAKMSKKERRIEKEARRKIREPMTFYKINDPHRIQDDPPYPYKKERRRKISDASSDTSDSDEEATQLNIEISSIPHSKSKPTIKLPLPTSSVNSLVSLAATRRALLSKHEEEFQFDGPVLDTCEERTTVNTPSTKVNTPRTKVNTSRRSSSTDSEPRSRTKRNTSSRSRSASPGYHHYSSSSSSSPHRRARLRSSSRSRSNSPAKGPPPTKATNVTVKGLKPHERLKLKLQKQITKQLKQEKKKGQLLEEQKEQEMMEREEELREMKRRIRDREDEERRSRYSRSKSRSPHRRSRSPRRSRSRHKSRSRSRSDRSKERRRDSREKKEPVEPPGGLVPEYHQYQSYENNYNESTEHQRNDYRPCHSRYRPRRYNRSDGYDERRSDGYDERRNDGYDERRSYNYNYNGSGWRR